LGREREVEAIDGLLAAARAGGSRALVLRGEPGIGLTAILEYAAESATGMRVVRAAGVVSEIRLPFAALHQLCGSMLDRIAGLPQLRIGGLPREDALALLESVVDGQIDADVGDRILEETGGNPLALVELPAELTPEELSAEATLPDPLPLGARLERKVLGQV